MNSALQKPPSLISSTSNLLMPPAIDHLVSMKAPGTTTDWYIRIQEHFAINGRATHPVVMVSYDDAVAYAQWLSKETDSQWRLPTEHEWVKAARGTDGRIFPWGDEFDAAKLNSHDSGPFDTVPVGSRSTPGPFGLTDAAGQVFEWIISTEQARRSWVKGGSWDDKGCGVCRPSARHSRPKTIKHILIGFRLVKE
jgi:formylglycine-generating enzyme required for sulfatase activity